MQRDAAQFFLVSGSSERTREEIAVTAPWSIISTSVPSLKERFFKAAVHIFCIIFAGNCSIVLFSSGSLDALEFEKKKKNVKRSQKSLQQSLYDSMIIFFKISMTKKKKKKWIHKVDIYNNNESLVTLVTTRITLSPPNISNSNSSSTEVSKKNLKNLKN